MKQCLVVKSTVCNFEQTRFDCVLTLHVTGL